MCAVSHLWVVLLTEIREIEIAIRNPAYTLQATTQPRFAGREVQGA